MLELIRWMPAYNNIVVLRSHKLLFCPIPKVACSNWKITLRHAEGQRDSDETIAHDRDRNGLTYLYKLKRIHRAAWLIRPDVTRAVFVRNPWTRVLSAYRSKLEGLRPSQVSDSPRRRYLKTVLSHLRKDDAPISFDEFIGYLEATPPEQMNEHWQPQSQIAGLGYVRYDFIGQFEQLERDVENIVARCGLPQFYCGEIKTVPPTHSSRSEQIRHYYTPELIERVGRIYAEDVRQLGYSWPDKIDDLARAALPTDGARC